MREITGPARTEPAAVGIVIMGKKKGVTRPANRSFVHRHRLTVVPLGLAVLTFVVYARVQGYGFITYDDPAYVTQNSHVLNGLNFRSAVWAFTTGHASNWHPVTWLSHMLDCTVFGLAPGGHHGASLLFHILNTVLLYLLFLTATGALWRSAFIAALFAVHPLHIESVAWIAERKDVLSTFFWMLSLLAYLKYARRRRFGRAYAAMIVAFALGLMAKPMLVSLPLVLLLMDFWPLNALRGTALSHGDASPGRAPTVMKASGIGPLILEKLPLLALAVLSSAITLVVQKRGGAMGGSIDYPLPVRIANAAVSYLAYIGKMLWPRNLAVFYPHPGGNVSFALAGVSLVVLAAVTGLVLLQARKRPYLLVGWLWYIVTLLPVIGIIQVGAQAMADRYTYIPIVGLLVMAAWGVPDLAGRFGGGRAAVRAAGWAAVAVCAVLSWNQLRYWRGSEALFRHAIEVTDGNWLAHNNLGTFLSGAGRYGEAREHYREALRIEPDYAEAWYNLGTLDIRAGDLDAALVNFRKALDFDADNPKFHNNYANVLFMGGETDRAAEHYRRALELDPAYAEAHNNLGLVLERNGRREDAIVRFREALRLKPGYEDARRNLERLGDADTE